jgi:hypothetical protein
MKLLRPYQNKLPMHSTNQLKQSRVVNQYQLPDMQHYFDKSYLNKKYCCNAVIINNNSSNNGGNGNVSHHSNSNRKYIVNGSDNGSVRIHLH